MDAERVVANKFLEQHPEDAVRILEKMPEKEAASLLESTPLALTSRVVQMMDVITATHCLTMMNPARAGHILEHLPVTIAAMFLRRISDAQRSSIFEKMTDKVTEQLQEVLKFPEGTAGAIMNAHVFTLLDSIEVKDAIKDLRENAQQLSLYIYVVDREKRLVGVVNLRELFLASPGLEVSSIMQKNVKSLSADNNLSTILVHPGWLSFSALPVLEEGNFFVGDLHFKTLLKLQREDQRRRKNSGHLGPAGTALGELYQIGLSGLLKSIVSPVTPEDEK